MEKTLVLLKPGCLQRRIAGEIIQRFERKGLKIIALKLLHINRATGEAHYDEHRSKDFYGSLVDYIVSGPVIALILEGNEAISVVRRLVGPTRLGDAVPGSIRGDYAAQTQLNIIHASDSSASAERECALFFRPEEICPWEDGNQSWF
jgi:nucleoside-diphosphate kinase